MNTFLFGFGVGMLLGVLAGIFLAGLMTISKISDLRNMIANLQEEKRNLESKIYE